MKQLTLIQSGTPDGLKKRNTEIAGNAARSGRTYADLAEEYHLTRERVRQIVALLEPEAYLRRHEAWKKRKKIVDYGLCPKCGTAKRLRDVRPRRRIYRVDPEGRFCLACVRRMSRRTMTLRCRCGRKKQMASGRLLNLLRPGRYKNVRLSPERKNGDLSVSVLLSIGYGKTGNADDNPDLPMREEKQTVIESVADYEKAWGV